MRHAAFAVRTGLSVCLSLMATSTLAMQVTPLPLPKRLRIESAAPRVEVWKRLSSREKKLAYHLARAARVGRDLLFHQSHRLSLPIKRALMAALSRRNAEATRRLLGDEAMGELTIYAAKFLDQGGPYGSSNRKYCLSKAAPEKVAALFKRHGPFTDEARADAVRLLTDPAFDTRQYPEEPEGAGLETAGGNLYARGVTGAEVKKAVEGGLKIELNCRVVRGDKGLKCEKQTTATPGIVGRVLGRVVGELKLARRHASTEQQRQQIDRTIAYFEKGSVDDFRSANIAWVRDRASSGVDFMLGWVEVYEDWLARIGSWESYVQIVDPQVSRQANALAAFAQEFEDGMPFGEFKKKFPADYSPPAIMVYYFQEIASYRSGGYNLPNFDDIRRDVGAKNVIRLPLPGEDTDPEIKTMYAEMLSEFLPSARVAEVLALRRQAYQSIVLLHEIIGHGSGTYDVSKYGPAEDPISGLGALGSALEEQRADLAALVFLADKRLIDVGLYKDADDAEKIRRAGYDYYIADFLRRLSGQRTLTEAHQRGHWLFVKRLLDKGVVAWTGKDGGAHTVDTAVLAVKDYSAFHREAVALLGELQRIKALRDDKALKALFAEGAPLEAVGEPWAQAIIRRGQDLLINAGYVEQPWTIGADLTFRPLGAPDLAKATAHWGEFY